MKRLLFIGLFFVLFTFICQAQSINPKQNLKNASQEDLSLYLRKAKKTKTAGAILSIIGPVMGVTGGLIFNNNFGGFYGGNTNETLLGTGAVLVVTGFSATIVGLPLLINGSWRVKTINKIKSTSFNGVKMDLVPCNFYDLQTHNHQFGVTLKVSF